MGGGEVLGRKGLKAGRAGCKRGAGEAEAEAEAREGVGRHFYCCLRQLP